MSPEKQSMNLPHIRAEHMGVSFREVQSDMQDFHDYEKDLYQVQLRKTQPRPLVTNDNRSVSYDYGWINTLDWQIDAKCRFAGTEIFFPGNDDSHECKDALKQTRLKEARSFCNQCPVIEDCRQYALEHEMHGIWAGEFVQDLRRMHKKSSENKEK